MAFMLDRKWCILAVVLTFLALSCSAQVEAPAAPVSSSDMETAVRGLLTRLIKDRAKDFVITVLPREVVGERNYFEIQATGTPGEPARVSGSTGFSVAQGIMYYLKYHCNASVSWEADQMRLPSVLPAVNVHIDVLQRYTFYHNPCVFSYSSAFWSWDRWEREIDLMALMGVNLALALQGQEALWKVVYSDLGLTEAEIEGHFTGYAFLAWGRMGNIQGWGGPLSQQWHLQQLTLQHNIVRRMREFGMATVLPAFSGHVPEGLLRLYPHANVTRMNAWGHFTEPYTRTYFLSPHDPLFEKIGIAFIRKVTSELGSDHYYLCDPYNEMAPVTSDPTYLGQVSQAIYQVLRKADPLAVWVTQGWMFFNEGNFWQPPQAKAYLTSVPKGQLLILDLAAEVYPQYKRYESFYGQPFIFCLLSNYGGVRGLFGNVDVLLENFRAAQSNTTLVGIGMTPEGIGSNYVNFDLMAEMSWRRDLNDVTEWAVQYARRRYGVEDRRLGEAWKLLMSSVYNCTLPIRYHGKYTPIMRRPTLKPKTKVWYSLGDVVRAWDLLLDAAQESVSEQISHPDKTSNGMKMEVMKEYGKKIKESEKIGQNSIDTPETEGEIIGNGKTDRESEDRKDENENLRGSEKISGYNNGLLKEDTFQYDIVDITRELLLQVAGTEMVNNLVSSYKRGVLLAVQTSSQVLHELLSDVDLLLGTQSTFLLGRWLAEATNMTHDPQECTRIAFNARHQITLWGPLGEILDYAAKQWNGILSDYVSRRWELFGHELEDCLTHGSHFDPKMFNLKVFQEIEKKFAMAGENIYPVFVVGDSIKLSLSLYKKYRPIFTPSMIKRYDRELNSTRFTWKKLKKYEKLMDSWYIM